MTVLMDIIQNTYFNTVSMIMKMLKQYIQSKTIYSINHLLHSLILKDDTMLKTQFKSNT